MNGSRLQRWPWITALVAVVVVVSPLGQEVIHSAFYSGEQLARSIAWVVIDVYGGALLALMVVEWLVRWWWARRKKRGGA
jgi:hypothetical protein